MALFNKTSKPSIVDYHRQPFVKLTTVLMIVFLYAPIITLIAFSFNDSKRNIMWRGFSFKYYEKLMANDLLIEAFFNSLTIAFITTVVSVVLGVLSAYSLWRFKFPFKRTYEAGLTLPMVVPEICMGVSLMLFFNWVGYPKGLVYPLNLGAIILAHISFSFPFVTVIIRSRLQNFDVSLEEAGLDMGATNWQIMRDILLPFLKPSIIAGAIMAFTLSLDDFIITFFTAIPETPTFPLKVYSMIKFSVTPEVNAASTILILITLILVCLGFWYSKKSEEEVK
ncbi:MAG: ABC transporter permease [Alphaproteobacteria bacterium]